MSNEAEHSDSLPFNKDQMMFLECLVKRIDDGSRKMLDCAIWDYTQKKREQSVTDEQ
jgi:hypothetical protein